MDEKRSKSDKGVAGDKLLAAAAAATAAANAGDDKSPLALRRRKSISKSGGAIVSSPIAPTAISVATASSVPSSYPAGHLKPNSNPNIVPGGELLNEMNVFNIISGYGKRGSAGMNCNDCFAGK